MSALNAISACFLGLCLFLQATCAGAQRLNGSDTNGAAALPFKLSAGFLIVVEGRIGGLSNLKFVLDTGVTRSIVDRKIADKLKLPRHPNRTFDFDRLMSTESAIFPNVQFGPIQETNVSMLIANLAHVSTFASHIDALIGSDLLSLTGFTIDYDEQKVQFSSLQSPESANVRNSGPALLTVELQVQGQLVRLLVDSGFPDILLFEDRLQKRVPQLRLERVIDGFRIGGRMRAKKAILPSTVLGTRQTDIRVLLVEAPPDNVLPGIDGLLGMASLKARRINFNYATNSLTWE